MIGDRAIGPQAPITLPPAAQWALGELERALAARGWTVRAVDPHTPGPTLLVGTADTPAVREALAAAGMALPAAAEALAICRLDGADTPVAPVGTLLVAGRDERGLVYALTEVARAVALAATAADPFAGVTDTVEAPALAWRSMQLFLCNAELERAWYFREEFWQEYLGQLARCRYNNLSLTFGHQTAYLAPPYPFHVALPEYPGVHVPGFCATERERNLAMLRRIAAMARERGLHFTLGVWAQHDCGYGAPMVEGLDEAIRAECNALGLRRLLEACPAIDGVQFRMNVEAGVPEDRQLDFWELQFQAIRQCGRPIRLDIRAKGLANETIARAREVVPDTVVSTKFWCEHLGQPYGMPAIQRADARNYRRYGTWDLLAKPREWDLVYRLWSAGTQRALLWGDPEWVRRFAESCRFGGVGFEVMAPLTNLGAGNEPGAWRLLPESHQPYPDEYQRYWLFYLLFGRLGYSPAAPAEVWRRELRHRFGAAAEPLEQAYRAASGVLPLLTTVLQWSASLWRFWPEMWCGRTLDEDATIEPSDPTQFYGVAEYVEDALRGELCGKQTPARVAAHLRRLANVSEGALSDAQAVVSDRMDAEFRGTALDFGLLAGLARYHAERLEATTHLAFYRRSGHAGRLTAALEAMRRARGHWEVLSAAADGVYHDNLRFGRPNRGHSGHWKDRLPEVDAQVETLAELLAKVPEAERRDVYPTYPGECPLAFPLRMRLIPVSSARAGEALTLEIEAEPPEGVRRVLCHHRAANQTLPFRTIEMESVRPGSYRVQIPGDQIDAAWDLMVFFEVALEAGEAVRWPDGNVETPDLVIPTV